MRGLLASSIGVTCAAALALPLTLPATAATARPAPAAEAATAETTRATGPDNPNTPNAPGTSNAPNAPDAPNAPGIPGIPGIPNAADITDTPGVQGIQGILDALGIPGIPDAPDTPDAQSAPELRELPDHPDLPGSTQSLPLAPLARDRALGGASPDRGLTRRDVRRFSLLGVVWDDPVAELHGRVQVRTRPAAGGDWSGWQDLETHNADHGADPDTPESSSGHVRGATAPLWVGDSDGVEVRVHPDAQRRTQDTGRGLRTVSATEPLPSGLRLELVDPGAAAPAATPVPAGPQRSRGRSVRGPGDGPKAPNGETATSAAATAASAVNAGLAPLGAREIPALDRLATERELFALRGTELTSEQRRRQEQRAKPYIGPRPRIVTRRGWGADESLRETGFRYTTKVKAAFVHHTATGNSYKCSQAPSVIRGIYRYHVKSMGWRDIGYNFLVDKCGNIYEGRAGGVAKAVLGAHTLGFNTNSMGIAVLGSFATAKPTSATVTAVARLTAWKLGLFGGNPKGKTYLKSGGGNLYRKGKNVRLNVISGHRDGFATECPGRQLYGKLGSARSTAARYQGR
ncbi:peptidoglycan recognition protein [Streptomyces sp. NBC_01275]|uniref:peptidoglycan recognition protein family protein n=1 Tax=Streptomyces sp. NBC_01275 TaxID=2903807 RepID=UPI00225944C1|nr:peptidoglycan recognition protein [Streptomyces sp. NBC_01275]MCX4762599.1 peptidoglycan recognition protein [Streptomyces sp. NBC_01275]